MQENIGLCQLEENKELFFSPFLGRFDKRDILEEAPDSTEEYILAQQKKHRARGAILIAQAKETCNRCPILSACLEYSDSVDAPIYGVVAGLTDKERRARRELLRKKTSKNPVNMI